MNKLLKFLLVSAFLFVCVNANAEDVSAKILGHKEQEVYNAASMKSVYSMAAVKYKGQKTYIVEGCVKLENGNMTCRFYSVLDEQDVVMTMVVYPPAGYKVVKGDDGALLVPVSSKK